MIINTEKLTYSLLLHERGVRDTKNLMAVRVAMLDLMKTERYVTFIWKQLRGTRFRGVYKNFEFSTGESGGRTVFYLTWKQVEFVAYCGDSLKYSAGISSCLIDHDNVAQFDRELQELTENFDSVKLDYEDT